MYSNSNRFDQGHNYYDNSNFFGINKELDYSQNDNASSIDSRVLQVCSVAEKNFLEYQNSVKEIKKLKHSDFKYKNLPTSTKIDKTEANNRRSVRGQNYYEADNNIKNKQNYPGFPNNDYKIADTNKTIFNLQSDEMITSKSNGFKDKYNYFLPTNKSVNMNSSSNYKKSNAVLTKSNNLTSSQLLEKIKASALKTKKGENKSPFTHYHLKTGKKCMACELKLKIQNKCEEEHLDHIKFKINYDINKLLLEAKYTMKKLNFKKSYEMLKLPISQGLHHADIFYLFGEVCRILKKLEESEKYLLECLKFEHHSPFVFYSLGLLYQELLEYRYSVAFFKHFARILETADVHYQISKGYIGLKKNLKAAIHITKAINTSSNVGEYYKFRASIYESMGFKELAIDDLEMARSII